MRICILFILLAAMPLLALMPPARSARAEEPRARVTIMADGKKTEYIDMLITPSDFTVAEEIELRRINAPMPYKMELVDEYIRKGASYRTAMNVCFPRLDGVMARVRKITDVPAEDARVECKDGRLRITDEREGRALDEERLYQSIYCAFKYGVKDVVTASVLPVKPGLTRKELSSRTVLRGEYTTDYTTSGKDRAHNVTKALMMFNGVRLPAGESISFNGTVGDRSVENGFRTAKIIVDGKYVDGVGGGVCQASTAVYNASLRAGLRCAANAHSICPTYCPPGLDAMISGVSDLNIFNPTDHDVYFCVSAGGGRGTVCIYGEKCKYTVRPVSEVIRTVPFDVTEVEDTAGEYVRGASGDRALVSPGREGYESETFLEYYSGDSLIKREKIRVNRYRAVARVIAVSP